MRSLYTPRVSWRNSVYHNMDNLEQRIALQTHSIVFEREKGGGLNQIILTAKKKKGNRLAFQNPTPGEGGGGLYL